MINSLKLIPLLVMVGILLSGCQEEAPLKENIIPVKAMRVADASGLAERAFPGRAKATQEVNLSFRVSGPLIAFPVDVGDEVQEGSLLVRMDPKDYETALGTLKGQLEQEQARRKRAQKDLTRLENTYKTDPGAVSEAAIDRARQVRDSASASVRSLESSVKNARDQLSYTELKAPFDGVVVETYVDNFETVVAKQPILRLLDTSSLEFIINVPENLIGLAPYVETITVNFDALPGTEIAASIKEIGKEASQATRTYPVTLAMEQPEEGEILPGMAGNASITTRPPDKVKLTGIEIPATAVFSGADPNKSYVWIVDEETKTLSQREVQIGKLARFGVLIKGGLKPGEWIVVKGVNSLEDGQQVRIIDVVTEEKMS